MSGKHVFMHTKPTDTAEAPTESTIAEQSPDPLAGQETAFASTGHTRGHDAYAAQSFSVDELPSFSPGLAGTLGGLFPQGNPAPTSAEGEEPSPTFSQEELAALCLAQICPSCPTAAQAQTDRLRALADLDNARKRLQKEKEDQIRFAAEGVLGDILPALDTLELALQHANPDKICADFVAGVAMTRKMLLDSLQKYGLSQVGAIGQPFDPALHEAVGMNKAEEVPDGHICALLACGYTLRDRLLRPARVVVCKKD